MLISGHLLPPGSASGSGIAVWEESGACGHGEPPSWAREAEGQFGQLPAYFGRGPSDPTAPHYDGAAERLEADRERTGRVRPVQGPKALTGLGPAPETRPPTRTEVLGQKLPRGTPGVPASKIESRSPASCSPDRGRGQALLFETRRSSPRQRPRGSRAPSLPSPASPLAGRADSGEAR